MRGYRGSKLSQLRTIRTLAMPVQSQTSVYLWNFVASELKAYFFLCCNDIMRLWQWQVGIGIAMYVLCPETTVCFGLKVKTATIVQML